MLPQAREEQKPTWLFPFLLFVVSSSNASFLPLFLYQARAVKTLLAHRLAEFDATAAKQEW